MRPRDISSSEAAVASLIIITIVVTLTGALFGAYLGICFAISREDRMKWSLRSDPSTFSAQTARALVGINRTRRD
jgi:ABC-type amino acid transport system permease subunit